MIRRELVNHLKKNILRYLIISFVLGGIAAPVLNLVGLIVLLWAGFLFLLINILIIIVFKIKRKYSTFSGITAGILIMIVATTGFSLLMFKPAKVVQRYLVIKHAGSIIRYVENYKKEKGEYPDLDVNKIASPKRYGLDQYFYFSKQSLLKKGNKDDNRGIEKKNDFYEIGFRQYGIFIDSDYVLYRSDKDYSHLIVDLKNTSGGWKYYFDHF